MLATNPDAVFWKPHPGQQVKFLSSPAFEALFGGAAGPGKSDCLVVEALRQVDNPRYNGILFRRTFTRLEGADGLIARSERWYPTYGAKYNAQKHFWKFPSGARIYFGHMEHAGDEQMYQGWQFGYIAFDELTEFERSQYMYLFTRCRADVNSRVRCYIRSATNPGGIGHEWVKQRFISTDIVNKVKTFALVDEVDTHVDKSHPQALSRAFYPATMADNPAGDPEYRNRILLNPDTVERARLLDGNWDVMDLTGRVYPMWSYDNISETATYNPDLPVYWGVDDGFQPGQGKGTISYHPRVFLFFQINPDGSVNLFDEYYAIQELSEKSLDNVMKLPYKLPEAAHIDSSASELRQRIWESGIQTVTSTHKVSEGVKNMRRFILDAQGIRAFKINPKCKEFMREIAAYKVDENATRSNAGEPVPLKIDDHGPDAARYFLWSRRYEYA
jgi:hypothetical protein